MKILFTTNLDWYKGISWPVLEAIPHKGELVQVHPGSENFCDVNKIPKILEVVQVTHTAEYVRVEL